MSPEEEYLEREEEDVEETQPDDWDDNDNWLEEDPMALIEEWLIEKGARKARP